MNSLAKMITIALLSAACLAGQAAPVMADTADYLWRQISGLLRQGRELEACEVATKMAPFEGHRAYIKAEKALLKRGISITSPLKSYSLKQIVALENALEAKRSVTGKLPQPGVRDGFEDAWGTALRVEMITRRTMIYLIRSAGPDKIFFTMDDLAIGVREQQEHSLKALPGSPMAPKRAPAKTIEEPEPQEEQPPADHGRSLGRSSMYQGRGPSQREGSGVEMEGDLDALQSAPATSGGQNSGGEQDVSLDDLLGK